MRIQGTRRLERIPKEEETPAAKINTISTGLDLKGTSSPLPKGGGSRKNSADGSAGVSHGSRRTRTARATVREKNKRVKQRDHSK